MAWWKGADKREIPSPEEVKAMMGYGPDAGEENIDAPVPAFAEGAALMSAQPGCVGIAHDCRCPDCAQIGE